MAILFMDSFSGYETADLPTRWPGGVINNMQISTAQLPPNSQVGAQVLDSNIGGGGNGGVLSNNFGALTRYILGFRYYRNVTAGAGTVAGLLHTLGIGNLIGAVYLQMSNSGTFLTLDNGSILATGPIVPYHEWHHFELDLTLSTTGGATLTVYKDANPTPFMTVTGVSTSAAVAEQFFLGRSFSTGSGSSPDGGYFADFYAFSGGVGAAPENGPLAIQSIGGQALGGAKMAFTVPAGAGRISNWTANGAGAIWQCIDQIPQDGDTTYASSSTVSNAFMVTLGAVPVMSTLIAVQVSNYAREDDAGPRSYQSGFGNGTSETYSGMDQFLGGTYNYIEDEFPLNPVTGVQWVPGDLAALQVGLKLTN